MIKKAMVMAAGVGSRLDPLTKETPKPLVPVLNKPVMDILLEKLKSYGIESVIANTHYLAEQIQERYSNNSPVDIEFEYIHECNLSGTAGGLKKCEFFFKDVENFVVVSADGLHDADLDKIIKAHEESGCIATMAISAVDHEEVFKYGVVVPSKDHTVSEFQEKPPVELAKSDYINTGIYVFNKRIFDFIPENQKYDFAKNVFPALMVAGEKINVYRIYSYWSDIGTINQYIQSNIDALNKNVKIGNVKISTLGDCKYVVGEKSYISGDVVLKNNVVIGNNCHIGKNVILDNVILWDDVVVEDNVHLKNVVSSNNTTFKSSVIENTSQIFGANSEVDFAFTQVR